MDLSIIIVNYKTRELLRQCLDSLLSSGCALNYEIIVVDNDSKDGSTAMIRNEYKSVILIENHENAGLSKGNNNGAAKASGKFLLFMNPDTVVKPGSLEKMVDYLRSDPEVGILGPMLVYPDGDLQNSCRSFYDIRTIILRRTFLGKIFPDSPLLKKHLMQDSGHDAIQDVDWMLGACLIMPAAVLNKIGGWDERYRLYFEDVDMCYRIHQAGYRVVYFPPAVVVHHHRRDSANGFSRKTLWHIESAVRFFNKFGWKL